MSGEFEWVDEVPPPANGQRGGLRVWERLLSPLMERPGQWAKVREMKIESSACTTASNITHGRVVTPPGRFEGTARKQPDGTVAIYARYLGPEEPGSSRTLP